MTADRALLALAGALLAATLGATVQEMNAERLEAQESQVKANLHEILISVERYSIDHEGHPPQYIWGGSVRSWLCHMDEGCAAERGDILDPLLAGGYLNSYPDNPFVNRRTAWCMLVPDPRFGCVRGEEYDYPDGPKRWLAMGNMLSDPRVEASLALVETPTESGYDALYFLGDPAGVHNIPQAGHFVYRSFSVPWDMSGGCPAEGCPQRTAGFALGAYGGTFTQGSDYLHCADPAVGFAAQAGEACPGYERGMDLRHLHWNVPVPEALADQAAEYLLTPFGGLVIWTKERELLGSGEADVISRPCEFGESGCMPGGRAIGNPDGYPDGIITMIHNWRLLEPPAGPGRGWTPSPAPAEPPAEE